MLAALTLVNHAWADVAPGCDTQPEGASPWMLSVMLVVMGVAIIMRRRNRAQDRD